MFNLRDLTLSRKISDPKREALAVAKRLMNKKEAGRGGDHRNGVRDHGLQVYHRMIRGGPVVGVLGSSSSSVIYTSRRAGVKFVTEL